MLVGQLHTHQSGALGIFAPIQYGMDMFELEGMLAEVWLAVPSPLQHHVQTWLAERRLVEKLSH